MTTGREFWRPSYLPRAPGWYDGTARLLDLGSGFDLDLPAESSEEAIAKDWLMVGEDMRRALGDLRSEATAIAHQR